MTLAQKLEALLNKAIASGWNREFARWIPTPHKLPTDFEFDLSDMDRGKKIGMRVKDDDEWLGAYDVAEVLFNHDFARALFGDELVDHQEVDNDGNTWNFSTLAYQYHLQQAVISDDPVGYMYQAVFGGKDA